MARQNEGYLIYSRISGNYGQITEDPEGFCTKIKQV